MAKFNEYFDICEELYVVQGKTLAQISEETEVSQPTLSKWKSNGEWDKKRQDHLAQNQGIRSILEEIKLRLAKEVLKNLKVGEVNSQDLYALTRLVSVTSGKKMEKESSDDDLSGRSTGQKPMTKEELMKTIQEAYNLD